MKIDIGAHIMPKTYMDALYKKENFNLKNVIDTLPTMYDLDARFRIMDKFGDLLQVITLSNPAVEEFCTPEESPEFARIANDSMAELVLKNADRFVAAIACLPMNNMDATMKEIERCIEDLMFRGIQINSNINDKPLDSPEFFPIYEKMAQYNLPIWIHPMRPASFADYQSEKRSRYMIFHIFGWPYETAAAMTRLVMGGVFEKFPNLKFIVHHSGGMVPFLEQRIIGAYDHAEMQRYAKYKNGLTRAPIDYFKECFYYDTAIYGNAAALTLTSAFCGAEQMLFGSDFPYDSQYGERYIRQTIAAIEDMDVEPDEKMMIFEGNARKLLRLPI